MRCKHNWIYEGFTHIECAHPGCPNFDSKMHQYNIAIGDERGCMGWGVAWYVMSNIARRNTHFINELLYSVKKLNIIALDRDLFETMCEEQQNCLGDFHGKGSAIFRDRRISLTEMELDQIRDYLKVAIEIGSTRKLSD